jgi:hypothetical protein
LEPAIIMRRTDTHGDAVQIGGWLTMGKNSSGAETYYSKIYGYCASDNAGAEYGALLFATTVNGTVTNQVSIYNNILYPFADNVTALGTTANQWSDLFLGSGAVINFNAGGVLLEHVAADDNLRINGGNLRLQPGANATSNTASTYALQIVNAAGSSQYLTMGFDGTNPKIQSWSAAELFMNYEGNAVSFGSGGILPISSDGAAIGNTSRMWSDLFLASGAVINFNAGDVIIGHSANRLDVSGGSTYAFGYNGGALDFILERSDAHGNAALAIIDWYGKDSASNSQLYSRIYTFVDDNTSTSEDASIYFEPTIAGATSTRMIVGTIVQFPSIATTASGANAFLNSGASNQLMRSTSSAKYKKDVETLQPQYGDHIDQMRPVWYRSKAEADNPNWGYYGLIAEELASVDPRLVHYGYQEDQFDEVVTELGNGDKKKDYVLKPGAVMVPDGIQYDRLTVLLIDKVKRLQARIERLGGGK